MQKLYLAAEATLAFNHIPEITPLTSYRRGWVQDSVFLHAGGPLGSKQQLCTPANQHLTVGGATI